jgi:hypothetical protein
MTRIPRWSVGLVSQSRPTANGLETMVHGEMTADCERPLEQRDAMADITELAYRKY